MPPGVATLLTVRVSDPESPDVSVVKTVHVGESGESALALPSWEEGLGNAPCVDATVWDATLATAPVLTTCGATTCELEDYDDVSHGPCDDVARGCACRTEPATDPRAYLSFVALVLLRRRPRERLRVS